MKIDEWTSEDVHTSGGGEFPPCAGLTSNVLPEAQSTVSAESSQTGVSTRNAHIAVSLKYKKRKKYLIGMPYVLLMVERERHTTKRQPKALRLSILPSKR